MHKTTASQVLGQVHITELECSLMEVAPGRGALFVAMQPTFHFILDGACHLAAEDGSFQAQLEGGDFVVLPHGRRHSLSVDAKVRPIPAREAERVPLALARDVPAFLRLGHGAAPAFRTLSGVFRFPALTANPIVAALPAVMQRPCSGHGIVSGDALAEAVMAPGGRALVQRLSDLMLLEAVRSTPHVMAKVSELAHVWLRTYRIERAVAAVTAEPGYPWTLETLCKLVGMSRASFAEKYLARTGVPPMQHVASIRLNHAATLLRSTALTIAEVAHQSGYASESSFTRVFRQRQGTTPSEFRKAAWIQPME
ncbi:AraC family transcriptional regulator [Pseudomonas bharatica]|uniref:AraC family transcriptional regulator n=1 Tax=Pseudomonas bharatica TaxID=2692112 RepID=UPI003B2881E8